MLASKNINDLIAIVAALRNRNNGCVWNIKQTFESIIPYTLEETYEVIDAIKRRNRMDLCDELGDLLLQVVYHATLAEEEGSFSFGDVVYAITAKMIRRHPHVFGTPEQKKRGFVEGEWERIKEIEKTEQKTRNEEASLATDSAKNIFAKAKQIQPTDQETTALQKAAAKTNFDWHESYKVFVKLEKELHQFKDAIKEDKTSDIEAKFCDLYFSLLNLAHHLNIDSQKALKQANTKSQNRFTYIEKRLSTQSNNTI